MFLPRFTCLSSSFLSNRPLVRFLSLRHHSSRIVKSLLSTSVNKRKICLENDSKLHLSMKEDSSLLSPIGQGESERFNWKQVTKGSTLSLYMRLSKSKLSALVVSTTIFGFLMTPSLWVSLYSCASAISLLELGKTLTGATIGTALCVCAANSFNQAFEVPYDSQMKRTFNRVLPQHRLSVFHAVLFSISCSILGVATLYLTTNPLTSLLGALNIILYAFVYTPLKRVTIWNTWIGAVVGAIPPIMGYTASTGYFDFKALILGSVLFCWQFPHFNSLSYNLKSQYAQAGYRMMSVLNPNLNGRTCVSYSIILVFLTGLSCCPIWFGTKLTTPWFLLDANVLNLSLIHRSLSFYKNPCEASARNLFLFSLVHLPCYMLLMILHLHIPGEAKNISSNSSSPNGR